MPRSAISKLEQELFDKAVQANAHANKYSKVAKAFRELDRGLANANLHRIPVTPDGDCQWGALVKAQRLQGYSTPGRGALKLLVRQFMLDNREHYDEFIAADLGEQDTDEFFERLQVPGALGGEWGCESTLAAFSDSTGFGIRLLDIHEGNLRDTLMNPNGVLCTQWQLGDPIEYLTLCTVRGLHYDAVGEGQAVLALTEPRSSERGSF